MKKYFYPDGRYAGDKLPEGAKVVPFRKGDHKFPRGPKHKELTLDQVIPWLVAGGTALTAHSAVSSMLDDNNAEKEQKKSIWRKALNAIISMGAGAAAGYGGYRLGEMLKDAGASTTTGEPPLEVYDADEAYKEYSKDPWGSWGGTLGFGVAGIGAGLQAGKEALRGFTTVPKVDPSPSDNIDARIEARKLGDEINAYNEKVREYEKSKQLYDSANPEVARSAEIRLKQALPELDMLSSATDPASIKAREALQKEVERLTKLRMPPKPVKPTGVDVGDLEKRREAAERKAAEKVVNPERAAAFKRARIWGGGALGSLLPALMFGLNTYDHYRTAAKIRDGMNGNYEDADD